MRCRRAQRISRRALRRSAGPPGSAALRCARRTAAVMAGHVAGDAGPLSLIVSWTSSSLESLRNHECHRSRDHDVEHHVGEEQSEHQGQHGRRVDTVGERRVAPLRRPLPERLDDREPHAESDDGQHGDEQEHGKRELIGAGSRAPSGRPTAPHAPSAKVRRRADPKPASAGFLSGWLRPHPRSGRPHRANPVTRTLSLRNANQPAAEAAARCPP
jgi:hypothetical protein